MSDAAANRGQWGNQVEFMLACIGYAVGLGNVWRFPYLCYENGGGAFLVPYAISLVIAGLPIFFLELAIGQFSSLGPNVLYNKLMPIFSGLGWAMVAVATATSIYYNVIIAWTLYYLYLSFYAIFSGDLMWDTCSGAWNTFRCQSNRADAACKSANGSMPYFFNGSCYEDTLVRKQIENNSRSPAEEFYNNYVYKVYNEEGDVGGFEQMGDLQWPIVLALAVAWLAVFACLIKGVQSTGKVVYFSATFPYVVLVILLIRGATLEGAAEGVKFYITPNITKLQEVDVWRQAATQIFYSLGMGFGSLLTMASYNPFKNNCYRNAITVSLINCGTSVFAGFAIFSTLGFMAHDLGKPVGDVVKSGPGLAFIAYPEAIVRMPYPPIWAILFFFMLFTLGIDSQFAMVEGVTTAIMDQYPALHKRKWLIIGLASLSMFLLALPMCMGVRYRPSLSWSIDIFNDRLEKGGIYIFTLFDNYCATYALLLIAMLEVLVVAWFYGIGKFTADLEMMLGVSKGPFWNIFGPTGWYFKITWMFVSPIMLLVIFVMSFVFYVPSTYGLYDFPDYAEAGGWALAAVPIALIPIIGLVVFISKCCTQGQYTSDVLHPSPDWAPSHIRIARRNSQNVQTISANTLKDQKEFVYAYGDLEQKIMSSGVNKAFENDNF